MISVGCVHRGHYQLTLAKKDIKPSEVRAFKRRHKGERMQDLERVSGIHGGVQRRRVLYGWRRWGRWGRASPRLDLKKGVRTRGERFRVRGQDVKENVRGSFLTQIVEQPPYICTSFWIGEVWRDMLVELARFGQVGRHEQASMLYSSSTL